MAVIYDTENITVYGSYKTEVAARNVLKNAREAGWKIQGRKYPASTLARLDVTSIEHFRELDIEVEVTSIMGGTVTLRKSEVGGPCDPSTERYWSM